MMKITTDLSKHIPFWIQVYGVPPGLFFKPYVERLVKELANSKGEFLEFDPNGRHSFKCFRVQLDSSEPLPRGKILDLNNNKDNI